MKTIKDVDVEKVQSYIDYKEYEQRVKGDREKLVKATNLLITLFIVIGVPTTVIMFGELFSHRFFLHGWITTTTLLFIILYVVEKKILRKVHEKTFQYIQNNNLDLDFIVNLDKLSEWSRLNLLNLSIKQENLNVVVDTDGKYKIIDFP